MKRPRSTPRAAMRPPRRLHSFLPSLQTLEDRTTPTGSGWAMLADPEGDVFRDLNGNSTRDAGEPDVGPGWIVYVDANENGAFDTGEIFEKTGDTGHYNLLLPDGTHSIRVVPESPYQDDRRPLGTVVRDFPSIEDGTAPGGDRYSGLAWANNSLYVTFISTNFDDNVMYRADPMTGAALGPAVSLSHLGQIAEITFDGDYFWGVDRNSSRLVQFDFDGQEIRRLNYLGLDIIGVEWDGENLRALSHTAGSIYTIDPSGTGSIVTSMSTPADWCVGLTFDGSYLWVSGTDTATVYALDPATGDVQRTFTHHGDFGYGMAVRGTNLWLSDHTASRVFQYDLGYGDGRVVTVVGDPIAGVDLAVFQLGSVSGRVFNDNDNIPDGAQDANDGGLAGWRVYADSNANGRYDPWETSDETDALGNYTLSGLRPGETIVALDLAGQRQPRWSQVQEAPADGFHSFTLHSGEALSGKNFANFLDRTTPFRADEWGTFEGGEMSLSLYTGLSWVHFTGISPTPLEPNFAGATSYVADSTHGGYTDWRLPSKIEAQAAAIGKVGSRLYINGRYVITPPNYWLHWTSTTSSGKGGPLAWAADLQSPTGYGRDIGIGSSTMVAGVRDSGRVIDDGTAGYTATGFSAKNNSGAYQGDQSTAAKGDGSKTATWTFNGLEAGATYKVDATWKVVNGAASNAPFTVLEGATVVGSSFVNQSIAPNDFTVGTTSWEGLGTYTITGNSLTVRLSNQANGTVIADAVRIFKMLPSYAPPAPLMAAGGAAAVPVADAALTARQAAPLVQEALRRWRLAGADVRGLGRIDIQIADLPGGMLGMARGRTITLDVNAAGHGWFIDRTPQSDSEFARKGNQGEQGRIDLLTVLVHEVGHLLGRSHGDGGAMDGDLGVGERESPTLSPRWGVAVKRR